MADNKNLLSSIEKGAQLKHAETQHDASAPKIEEGVSLKKVDRDPFLKEVVGDHQLKHADTKDASAPKIDSDTHIKTVDRSAFLKDVETAATKK